MIDVDIQIGDAIFLNLLADELKRARRMHPTTQSNLHEGYAVLLEEVDEFKAQVWKKDKDRDLENTLHELVSVAAMACRAAVDNGLVKS